MNVMAVALIVGLGGGPVDGTAFDKLKALEGQWRAGSGEVTKYVTLQVISNGTAVLETVTGADRLRVLSASVFHLENGKLVVSHFGPGGAVRLEAKSQGKLEFEGKGAALAALSLSMKDDRLIRETSSSTGKVTLDLSREYVDTLK
jgi:hypothetical protein